MKAKNLIDFHPKFFETLKGYSRDKFASDVMAGIIVGIVAIPLAIAFGTAHGVYKKKPVLDLDRIRLIREKVNVPLVMHGGSGLTKEEFHTAIKNGIRKINYYTYMAIAAGKAVKDYVENLDSNKTLFYHDISVIAKNAMKEDIKQAIKIFSLMD